MAENTLTIPIDGMSCGHCVASVKDKLSGMPGMTGVEVTLKPGQAVVTGSDLSPDAIKAAIEELGFDAG